MRQILRLNQLAQRTRYPEKIFLKLLSMLRVTYITSFHLFIHLHFSPQGFFYPPTSIECEWPRILPIYRPFLRIIAFRLPQRYIDEHTRRFESRKPAVNNHRDCV